MQIKFNKDAILKNRFWIILGITVVCTLAGLVYLQTMNADELKKGAKKALDDAKKQKNVVSPSYIETVKKHTETAKALESKIWSSAYELQKDLFKWSPEVENKFEFYAGKFTREISVNKGTDKASWPADTDSLIHGILMEVKDDVNGSSILLKDRKDKQVRIHKSENLKIVDADQNKLTWREGLPAYIQKSGFYVGVTFQTGKYFNDVMHEFERKAFNASYYSQVHEILRSIEPLDEKGEGVVQLKNWAYHPEKFPDETMKFMRFVSKKPVAFTNPPWNVNSDFSAEAWIAQEDLWVQKEIYRVIKSVNDDIKVYKPMEVKKGNPVRSFQNTNFQIDLVLDKDKLNFTITNLLPRKQKLDMNFRVRLSDGPGAQAEVLRFSDAPLAPAGSKTGSSLTKSFDPDNEKYPPRTGIYGIEQVLTWETAAIKRLDHVTIGSNDKEEISNCHRLYGEQPLRALEEKEAAKEDPKDNKGGDFGAGKGAGFGFGKKDGKDAGANKGTLFHGLWTHRYFDVTQQSRRIPVGVALVVDQDHVDRVLTAFNNSKLRFLTTEVLLNQYGKSLAPAADEKKDTGDDKGGFGQKGGFPMGGQGGNQGQSDGGVDSENNMELVIYGIMTLYQRYPPRAAVSDKK